MVSREEAIEILHSKSAKKQLDQALVVLGALGGGPCKNARIKEQARLLGVKGAKDWNVSGIFGSAGGLVTPAEEGGWLVSSKGKIRLIELGTAAGVCPPTAAPNGAPSAIGAAPSPSSSKLKTFGRKVFVVHGHDELLKAEVARLLLALEFEPIILHEQPNGGKTIIEKFEKYSNVGFAVALLTPDDVGAVKPTGKAKATLSARARQNVVFEMGFFFSALGRGRTVALYKPGTELPSDVQGIVYTKVDGPGKWKYDVAKELKEAGYAIDMDKVA